MTQWASLSPLVQRFSFHSLLYHHTECGTLIMPKIRYSVKVWWKNESFCVSASKKFFLKFMDPGVSVCVYVSAIPAGARRGHCILRSWSYWQFWALMWVLETKLGSSGRVVHALSHGLLTTKSSLLPGSLLFKCGYPKCLAQSMWA